MNKYLVYLTITLSLSLSLYSCKEGISSDDMSDIYDDNMTTEMTIKIIAPVEEVPAGGVLTKVAGELVLPDDEGLEPTQFYTNIAKNMRIFLFSSENGMLMHELRMLEFTPSSAGVKDRVVKCRIPFGTWDIFAVSNLEADAVDYNINYTNIKTKNIKDVLYEYQDKNKNSPHIVKALSKGVVVTKNDKIETNLDFKRMVGKIYVSIQNNPSDFYDLSGHTISFGLPQPALNFNGELSTKDEFKTARQIKLAVDPSANESDLTKREIATFVLPTCETGTSYAGDFNIYLTLKSTKQNVEHKSSSKLDLKALGFAANKVMYLRVSVSDKTGSITGLQASTIPWATVVVDVPEFD